LGGISCRATLVQVHKTKSFVFFPSCFNLFSRRLHLYRGLTGFLASSRAASSASIKAGSSNCLIRLFLYKLICSYNQALVAKLPANRVVHFNYWYMFCRNSYYCQTYLELIFRNTIFFSAL
jgi:hypothetical protein